MDGDTTTVDLTILEERLGQLSAALHVDAARILEDEARLLLREVIKISPPKTKKQGESTIERDSNRIFETVTDDFAEYVAENFGTENVQTWMTGKRGKLAGKKIDVQWEKLDVHGYGMDAFHQANRNPVTGHTNRIRFGQKIDGRWLERYVVSESAFKAFLKRIQVHVGTLKGAWAYSYAQIGGKAPEWIRRHVGRGKGFLTGDLNSQDHPFIRMINRADGIGNTRQVVARAVKIRVNAITRRLNLITNGYAQDIVRKMKVSPKAFTTSESFSVSE